MGIGHSLIRALKASVTPLLFLAIAGYFGWSATQGNHGLVAYAQRQELLRQAEADRIAEQKEYEGWDRRVSGLRANHLDPDTLDERARAMLNLADPSDIIVPYATKDRLY